MFPAFQGARLRLDKHLNQVLQRKGVLDPMINDEGVRACIITPRPASALKYRSLQYVLRCPETRRAASRPQRVPGQAHVAEECQRTGGGHEVGSVVQQQGA